jgi:hypothetical protein
MGTSCLKNWTDFTIFNIDIQNKTHFVIARRSAKPHIHYINELCRLESARGSNCDTVCASRPPVIKTTQTPNSTEKFIFPHFG